MQVQETIHHIVDIAMVLVSCTVFRVSKCEDCAGCTQWNCDCANIEAQAKADTVRKMKEIIYERLDISVEGYSSEEIKSDVRDMVYQIAEEILEE